MEKEDLKEYTFYYWKEINLKTYYMMEDMIFITYIDKDSSPENYRCSSIEIDNINSDLIVGNTCVYHFLYGEKAKNRKYIIKEISFDDIDKKLFLIGCLILIAV